MSGRDYMKRTCQMIIALCLPLVLCGPVRAQHSGPYVGAFIGGNALMDSECTDSKGNFSLEFDPALQGSVVAGWDFAPGNPVGEGRIELEYTHRSNQLNQAKFAEGDFNGEGDLKVDSLLVNFIGYVRSNSPWSPYGLVGMGAARMEASDLKVTGGAFGNGTSNVFAYQAGVGVDLALKKNLSLDLGYRFFGSIRPEFTEANGQKFKMDYYSHSAVFGMRYGF
jgi:opacity protein-like surface antigen